MPQRRLFFAVALAASLVLPGACDKSPPANSAKPEQVAGTGGAAEDAIAAEAPKPGELPKAASIHYVERVLGGANAEDPLPMIIAIHGLGDDPENFADLFATFPEKARLILPRGIDKYEDGGWSWFPIRARDRNVEALSTGIKTSADKLAESIKVLTKDRPTKGNPIITGFSQGGMLTFTLAVHHPDITGVAIPLGGWLPPPLWPDKKAVPDYPPITALHGTADPAVRYETTKESIDHLNRIGINVTLKSYEDVPHTLTPEMRRDLEGYLRAAVRTAG